MDGNEVQWTFGFALAELFPIDTYSTSTYHGMTHSLNGSIQLEVDIEGSYTPNPPPTAIDAVRQLQKQLDSHRKPTVSSSANNSETETESIQPSATASSILQESEMSNLLHSATALWVVFTSTLEERYDEVFSYLYYIYSCYMIITITLKYDTILTLFSLHF